MTTSNDRGGAMILATSLHHSGYPVTLELYGSDKYCVTYGRDSETTTDISEALDHFKSAMLHSLACEGYIECDGED